MFTLLVTKGPDLGRSSVIRSGRVSVGTDPDMGLLLTDRSVRPRHFMLVFDKDTWKALTYESGATILVDRRWRHPMTGQRGARILVGNSRLLLFAGEIDLETARSGDEALDLQPKTLRDGALTEVDDRGIQFRVDMTGKALSVGSPKNPNSSGKRDRDETPGGSGRKDDTSRRDLPEGVMRRQESQLYRAKPGMMRLPETIEKGRTASPPPAHDPQTRAIAARQMISLTDTAISAMPSQSRDLILLHDRDGPFAAELRILATRLESLRSTLGYKSFLITSPGDGDGKTVLSSNLALAMSEDPERKVALVDANFRNPRAGELFNLDRSRGLLSALSGERPLAQCVARVLARNLIVLHAGGEHKNPSSILSSPKFKTLLNELAQAVDFMILDAPSALPQADVPLLAQLIDGVLIVAAAEKTRRAELDKALEVIGRNRIVGAVFVNTRASPTSKAKKET